MFLNQKNRNIAPFEFVYSETFLDGVDPSTKSFPRFLETDIVFNTEVLLEKIDFFNFFSVATIVQSNLAGLVRSYYNSVPVTLIPLPSSDVSNTKNGYVIQNNSPGLISSFQYKEAVKCEANNGLNYSFNNFYKRYRLRIDFSNDQSGNAFTIQELAFNILSDTLNFRTKDFADQATSLADLASMSLTVHFGFNAQYVSIDQLAND